MPSRKTGKPKKELPAYHPEGKVNLALIQLTDALLEFHAESGVRSILILREVGFSFRAMNGNPCPASLQDRDLLAQLGGT